jgi:putative NADH-flavin reductase
MIGSRILDEAQRRGHEVIAIVRNPDRIALRAGLTLSAGDATDAASIAASAAGADLAISAYSPGAGPQDELSKNARALLAGLADAGIGRVIVVGGAGSLEIAPGKLLVDAPNFPEAYKARALAQTAALDIFRSSTGTPAWTFVSPAALIAPGDRTGTFRVGGDQFMVDAAGESKISAEDYAVAILDEAEHPQHLNARMSVAY